MSSIFIIMSTVGAIIAIICSIVAYYFISKRKNKTKNKNIYDDEEPLIKGIDDVYQSSLQISQPLQPLQPSQTSQTKKETQFSYKPLVSEQLKKSQYIPKIKKSEYIPKIKKSEYIPKTAEEIQKEIDEDDEKKEDFGDVPEEILKQEKKMRIKHPTPWTLDPNIMAVSTIN